MVGVSRQRVHKLANDSETFPAPEEIVGSRIRVWRREVVEEWAAATGRMVREEMPDVTGVLPRP